MQPLVALGVLGHHAQGVIVADLANAGGAGVFIEQTPQPLENSEVLGLGLVVKMLLIAVGVVRAHANEALGDLTPRRVIL